MDKTILKFSNEGFDFSIYWVNNRFGKNGVYFLANVCC